jgi:phosphoenolpyruvate synthase/pyruvate phosphate dikinase
MPKWVYDFAEGSREMRDLLGGKGANVAEMTRVLGTDRVPAGFTITTGACVAYMRADREEPDGMADEVAAALQRLEQHSGKRLGATRTRCSSRSDPGHASRCRGCSTASSTSGSTTTRCSA